jgi:DNA-binding SARP family transcriptional activator
MLSARLFGPLELEIDGRPLGARDLGGIKSRQLLEILLVERGHVVPKGRLAEMLWGDAPPMNVAATLDTYASTLRRILEPDRGRRPSRYVVGGGGGLLAPAETTEVDLHRFDDLLGAVETHDWGGQLGEARMMLEDALTLVRGEVLEEEPYASWALRLRDMYAERAVAARLAAAEYAWAGGDIAAALAHARQVVVDDRTREAAYRVVMLAAYRLGRQDEALSAFEHCRQALAEELGVDPLPETVALHAAILRRDDAALARYQPARMHAAAPFARRRDARHEELALLGRGDELSRLVSAGRTALEGDGGLVLIEGEPGIGKTRLIAELCAHLQPLRVGVGTCAEVDRDLSFVPLAAALRELGIPDLASVPAHPALGEVLPELPPSGLPPETARVRALESVRELIAGFAPVALVIDDLQWADPSTVAALAYLERRCGGQPVLLIAALRTEEVSQDMPATRLVPSTRVTLGPLAADDLAPLGDTDTAARLFERSGGHPLWLTELLRADDHGEGPTPPRLAELIVARCRRAGTRSHRLLAAASVLGRPFTPDLLAALLGDDPVEVAERLEELAARGLTRSVAEGFALRHDLIAEALAAGVSPARRRLLHERALHALEGAGATAGELAGHAVAAGLPEPACRWSLAAAAAARRSGANVEAAEHYRRARALADDHPDLLDAVARERLLVEFGAVLVTLGRVEEAETALREAKVSADKRGDQRRVFAALEGLAVARQRRASDPVTALALGRQALVVAERLGDLELNARAHTLVGSPSGSLGLLNDEIAHCRRAVELAQEAGAHPPGYPMARVALGLHHQGREHEALAWTVRAEQAAVEQDDEEALLVARWVRALACLALGRGRDAWLSLDGCSEVGRGEEVFWHARIPNTYASILADLCLHERALDHDLESLEAVTGATGGALREAEFQTRLNLAATHLALGDADAAAAELTSVRAGVDEVVYARFRWLARLHAIETDLAVTTADVAKALAAAEACLAIAAEFGQAKYAVRGRLALARAHLAAGEQGPARQEALTAALSAEGHDFRALAWRCWWVAHEAGAGTDAWRRAQAMVLAVADGLDAPQRAAFLAAVPVEP